MLTRREMVILAAAGTPTLLARSAGAQTPVVPAGAEVAFDRNATAEELVRAMFTVQSATGSDSGTVGTTDEQDAAAVRTVSPFLDPAYQMQRASGERYVAGSLMPADVDRFELVDVRETRPSDRLVVARYAARTPGAATVDTNLIMSHELRPRLTVFRWDEAAGHWKVLSHANFATPAAMICEQEPLVPPAFPEVPTSEEDVALGVSLVQAAADGGESGDLEPLLDPQVQVQMASGAGYTTLAERKPATKTGKIELSDYLVTRHEDVMVVSFRGRPSGTVLGQEVSEAQEPRLFTFRQDDAGGWKMIAVAYFSTVAKVPPGVDCVAEG